MTVAASWIVFSTIAAPLVIQKVIAGGELGGQLIAGATRNKIEMPREAETDKPLGNELGFN